MTSLIEAASLTSAQTLSQLSHWRALGDQQATALFDCPQTLEAAMDIQLSIELPGPVVDAGKVALAPTGDPVRGQLHPVLEHHCEVALPWRSGIKLEVEVAVRLRDDLPPARTKPYNLEDLHEVIGGFDVGVELVRSAISENATISFPLFLADRLGNDGYLLGPAFSREELDAVQGGEVAVVVNGDRQLVQRARHQGSHCLNWLLDLANMTSRPHDSLSASTLITTDALIGALEIVAPGKSR